MSAVFTPAVPSPDLPWRYGLTLVFVLLAAMLHVQAGTELPFAAQGALLAASRPAVDVASLQFLQATLPRTAMALLAGAALALGGSLLQQLTQNRLVDAMTMGAASGARLAMVCAAVWLPASAAQHGEWVAMAGAVAATALVVMIAGLRDIAGLPLVLGGMAMTMLLGALASGIALLNDQYARDIFIWGAGDLTQIDWSRVTWLLPRLAPAVLLALLACRPLQLLRLGSQAASARGLALLPVMLGILMLALWMNAVVIAAVGMISFLGLLAPNLARMLGARSARDELAYSALLGALLLVATDTIALAFSHWSADIVPSGAAAALIGAPGLLWFGRRHLSGLDQTGFHLDVGQRRLSRKRTALVLGGLLAIALLSLSLSPGVEGWRLAWPDPLVWSLRWPRTLTAIAAGCGLAVAGVVLQRVLRNPLASPEILGLSAGATLALLLASSWLGTLVQQTGPLVAFLGALLVLACLMGMGRRHDYAPGMMALVGLSLTALMQAALQFFLARGTVDSFAVLGWLAGSTYRIGPNEAVILAVGVAVLSLPVLFMHRGLTLISIGDGIALGRGLGPGHVRLLLLLIVALLCGLITSLVGPIAFLGLLAPHMARLFGARRILPQLCIASLLGSVLLLVADWLGRTILFPVQVPAGLLASILCGTYFILLLVRPRLSREAW